MATNGLSERSASQSGSVYGRNTRVSPFFKSSRQNIFKKLSKTSLDSHCREPPGTTTRPTESGSQKVQHRFGGFKHKIELNFESRIVVSTNSPDLERGPGTRSIGEEFFETTILVIELYVVCPVARARYPLGPRWGFTVVPHLGPPQTPVMPHLGADPAPVMCPRWGW